MAVSSGKEPSSAEARKTAALLVRTRAPSEIVRVVSDGDPTGLVSSWLLASHGEMFDSARQLELAHIVSERTRSDAAFVVALSGELGEDARFALLRSRAAFVLEKENPGADGTRGRTEPVSGKDTAELLKRLADAVASGASVFSRGPAGREARRAMEFVGRLIGDGRFLSSYDTVKDIFRVVGEGFRKGWGADAEFVSKVRILIENCIHGRDAEAKTAARDFLSEGRHAATIAAMGYGSSQEAAEAFAGISADIGETDFETECEVVL